MDLINGFVPILKMHDSFCDLAVDLIYNLKVVVKNTHLLFNYSQGNHRHCTDDNFGILRYAKELIRCIVYFSGLAGKALGRSGQAVGKVSRDHRIRTRFADELPSESHADSLFTR